MPTCRASISCLLARKISRRHPRPGKYRGRKKKKKKEAGALGRDFVCGRPTRGSTAFRVKVCYTLIGARRLGKTGNCGGWGWGPLVVVVLARGVVHLVEYCHDGPCAEPPPPGGGQVTTPELQAKNHQPQQHIHSIAITTLEQYCTFPRSISPCVSLSTGSRHFTKYNACFPGKQRREARLSQPSPLSSRY